MREWLIAYPIAHRGLHDPAAGIVENSASAFAAAWSCGYAVECDIQLSGDGEAMVFHDRTLDRLTDRHGNVGDLTAAELRQVPLCSSNDRIMSLGDLCDLAAGRTALFVEIKSRFDGDLRLVQRAAAVLAGYGGHVALMSFDPAPIAALCTLAPRLPRGIVAERRYTHPEWNPLSARTKRALAYFQHAWRSRPQFIAYSVRDLPSPVPWFARSVLGLPLLTWTVRSVLDRERAARYADQMIFEGFRP